ncbi:MAG: type IV pilus modification protein PilV [Gammaproteobacteria bacterium]
MRRMTSRGFTLIEVLVTLLIFSIGLLAVAGLQTISKKANYDALQRTTASLLASDIIERMRANGRVLEEYILDDGTGIGATVGGGTLAEPAIDCAAANCNATQMAWYDLFQWEQAIDGATELVDGAATGGLVSPTACIEGPFGGVAGAYRVSIAWRGVTPLSNPVIHACGEGSGLYGEDDEFRRILTVRTYITPTQ